MSDNQNEKNEQLQENAEQQLTPEEIKAARKARVKKEIREWIVALVTAVVLVVLIRMFLFTIVRVDGSSMSPTLVDDERMFITVLDKKLFGVERDDVVICHYPGRGYTYFVKRVVGVPGDLVERKNGVTYINTEPIDPAREGTSQGWTNGVPEDYSYTLAEEEYFCVGDNTYNSHDSRMWNDTYCEENNPNYVVGPLSEDMIIGKVRYVIWPLTEVRGVE